MIAFGNSGLAGLAGARSHVEVKAQTAARMWIDALRWGLDHAAPPVTSAAEVATFEIADADARELVAAQATVGAQSLQSMLDWLAEGEAELAQEDRSRVLAAIAALERVATATVDAFELAHGAPQDVVAANQAVIDRTTPQEELTWWERLASSPIGTGVVAAGAFVSGATGLNEEAIRESAGTGRDMQLVGDAQDLGRRAAAEGKKAVAGLWSLIPWWVKAGGAVAVGGAALYVASRFVGLGRPRQR